jgi:hypothetical protein
MAGPGAAAELPLESRIPGEGPAMAKDGLTMHLRQEGNPGFNGEPHQRQIHCVFYRLRIDRKSSVRRGIRRLLAKVRTPKPPSSRILI